MKFETLKPVLLGAVVVGMLASCSSTPSSETAGPDTSATIPTNEVATAFENRHGAIDGRDTASASSVGNIFFFDFNQSRLKAESLAALRLHAEQLIASPVRVRLEGHADERGTREYNMAFSERRGFSVKEFLVLQGVDSNLVEVISYGEERPTTFGNSEENWALNRRVELQKLK